LSKAKKTPPRPVLRRPNEGFSHQQVPALKRRGSGPTISSVWGRQGGKLVSIRGRGRGKKQTERSRLIRRSKLSWRGETLACTACGEKDLSGNEQAGVRDAEVGSKKEQSRGNVAGLGERGQTHYFRKAGTGWNYGWEKTNCKNLPQVRMGTGWGQQYGFEGLF